MPEEAGPGPTSGKGSTTGSASHLPWHLIPSFEPGETELAEYTKRLEFLAGIWPAEFLNQLAPRAALQCKGSAFQKVVRIPTEKLKVNDLTGVQLLVTTLGGVWGKTTLEDKYEKFERAIYGVSQRSDESNESYVARHEILFEDVVAQGASLSDMRAYILLRNSALSPEDKKRVVIEAKGNLKYETVIQAIRMLGAKFFHEVQGQQKSYRSKTYDVNHVQETEEEAFISEDHVYLTESNELPESVVEQFLNEGDEDALVVQQFEDALIDTVQNDTEMTAYMNAYVEARRKLTEKSKSRGFWPIRSKGFGKKGKGKGQAFRSRKPLAMRIAESDCRLCGQRGHWRAECPRRHTMGGSATNLPPKTQPTNVMVSVNDVSEDEADVFVMEAVESSASDVQASVPCQDPHDHDCKSHSHECFVVFGHKQGKARHKGDYYNQVSKRLSELLKEQKPTSCRRKSDPTEAGPTPSLKDNRSESFACSKKTNKPVYQPSAEVSPMVPQEISPQTPEQALFATSLTLGILDLGASQTVMGQHQLPEFFPRASERRVLPIVGVCKTSSHLHIFSSSHLLIFTSSHLHIFSSSHLLIFTSSHLHIFSSSHLLLIFSSSHLLIFTSSQVHIFSLILTSSPHLLIFTSSHLLIFSSSHLLIFTSSHLHIFSHLLIFTSSHIFPHLPTSSHIFSHLLTSSHIFSHLLTSSHIFSNLLTSSHIFSHLLISTSSPLALLPSPSFPFLF